ncbi:putative Neuroligin-4, X-linked [Cocos nucifera]|uniref:Putative Neuroligin-4, X-linked n=1 Tax=Cocos nucifera TaxID=13894 RepID=A0A8K0HYW9_COCNU|nr:putative Neuroligin-4, X-linked [Cocos nucifera]
MESSCPPRAFRYNATLCACDPGYYLAGGDGTCQLFDAPSGEWVTSSGVDPTPTFLATIFPIKRFTPSQAFFLLATLATLLSWLAFCAALRFRRLDGVLFRLRWGISRLDFCFATKHWLDDQMVVRKRKTELGGTFSVASWIFFIGLLSTLLYQVIAKRSIEVRGVRPTNAPDLLSFVNDMEFNITTISSMSCSHLRGLDTLVVGAPGLIDYRVLPLSSYVNYSCYNTSRGPTISLKCNSCQVPRQDHYISWQFIDLPNDPAAAVGFHFNLSAKAHGDDKHVSFVSGTLKSASYSNDTPVTFRGRDLNILKIHLFPERFIYLHDLRLIQPIFHDFLPGSSFSEARDLQASLQSSKDGLVNAALYIRYLSDYIVEIDKENVVGIGFKSHGMGLSRFSCRTDMLPSRFVLALWTRDVSRRPHRDTGMLAG